MENNAHENIKRALEYAYSIAHDHNNQYVLPETLLIGLVEKEPKCKSVFEKFCKKKNVDSKEIIFKLHEYLQRECADREVNPDLSVACIRIMKNANAIASENNTNITENTDFFFCAILMEDKTFAANCLKAIDMSSAKIVSSIKRKRKSKNSEPEINMEDKNNGVDEEWIGEFCEELVSLAKKGKIDEVIGRSDETERLIKTLNRRRKSNVVLVGEAGVGKTAVVEGLALKIAKNEVPDCLKDFKIYSLNITNLLAGSRFRGDFEEKVEYLVEELKKDEKSILFIDEIHTVLGCGVG